jgi:beta-phosphoglucomutase-like phosphatase (HAD superfamily)
MELSVDPSAKGLIFDLDGTLLDSMPLHYLAWKEICLEKLNYDFTEEFFYAHAGVSSDNIFKEIKEITNLDFIPGDLAKQKEKLYETKLDQLTLVEPVVDIAIAYHNKLPKSIGTGSPAEGSWMAIKAVGLDKYFDILVSKEHVPNPKPAPDTFLRCAELMGVDPKDCQVFEDGDPGLQAARTAGMIATDIRPFVNGRG